VWIVNPLKDKAVGDKIPIATGTGSLIDAENKIILTNYHVVGESTDVRVLFPIFNKDKDKDRPIAEREFYFDLVNTPGRYIPGIVVLRLPKVDLALIKLQRIPDGAQVVKLARDSASPGQRVHSVGNPGASGALWVYTSGTVRQVYHKQFRAKMGENQLLDIDARVVETQSPTNPGDSGGPLVNDRGELLGVTQGIAPNSQLMSTFIDLSEVKDVLKKAKITPQIASGAPEKSREPAKVSDGGEHKEGAAAAKTVSPEELAETRAARKLKNAREFLKFGQEKDAREYCEEILAQYPKTKAAVEAKELLDQLNKKKKH
jgi:S1-C subfamily serine protease